MDREAWQAISPWDCGIRHDLVTKEQQQHRKCIHHLIMMNRSKLQLIGFINLVYNKDCLSLNKVYLKMGHDPHMKAMKISSCFSRYTKHDLSLQTSRKFKHSGSKEIPSSQISNFFFKYHQCFIDSSIHSFTPFFKHLLVTHFVSDVILDAGSTNNEFNTQR